jgi:lysophospholipase L1-like esterase
MKMKLTWLGTIFLAVTFSAVSQAQESPADKWGAEIKKFQESDRRTPPARGAVLFIGSSSIRLWESLAADFPGTSVINRGFGGSEIADATFYVDRIVTPYRPKLVILYAGDNDLANGKSPRQVFEDFKAFVSRVRRELPAARIAFIAIKPSPARASLLQSQKDANELIKAYASQDKGLVYIDVFTPMLSDDGSPRHDLYGPDKLHMNKQGYRLWQSVIAPHLR